MPRPSFERLFYIPDSDQDSLGIRLRRMLVDVILDSPHPIDRPLPSTRNLARQLGIARATVSSAYSELVHEGLLLSRQRSGYFINPSMRSDARANSRYNERARGEPATLARPSADWQQRLNTQTAQMRNITKPKNWRDLPYPFISGQVDPREFPLAEWRQCCRNSLGVSSVSEWIGDNIIEDSEDLIEQIRKRLLPRRGITAGRDEILLTLGSQNALYLLSQALVGPDTVVGLEAPGYPDARNIFSMRTGNLRHIPVDRNGLTLTPDLAACDYVYVTPSHQAPTTVSMSMERRRELMEQTRRSELIILEDDYDCDVNFDTQPIPALKSMDTTGQVVYFASLSKSLAPGLRIGYIVAPKPLIDEIRALRRLMFRHPPMNIQHTLTLFLAQGSYDSLAYRLRKVHRRRWEILNAAMRDHLQSCRPASVYGGSSAWVEGPEGLDCERLAHAAMQQGIFIEPGAIYFHTPQAPCRWFRIGFSAIPEDRIEPGIRKLDQLIRSLI